MKQIIWFLICTFSLTYLSHGVLAYVTSTHDVAFNSFIGQSLFIIGGSSPTVFAIIFVLRQRDATAIKAFKKKLFSINYSFSFWFFAIGIPVFLGGLFQLLYIWLSNHTFYSDVPFYFFFMVLFTSILFGGIEEIGWRGFLQERLMTRTSLVSMAVLIGIVWGLWHVPLFFIENVSHYTFGFLPFMLGAIMFSTYLTWLYVKTKSILLTIIFHASINASAVIGLGLMFNHTLLTYTIIIGFMLLGFYLLISFRPSEKGNYDRIPYL